MSMDKLAEYLIQKETITGKEFMEIYCKEKGIPVPEPKTETMKKDRAKKAEEEKESADGEAEDREEKEVSGDGEGAEEMRATEESTEGDALDANCVNDEVDASREIDTSGATESTQSTGDDDLDDSDSEGPVLTGKDADFASELKNRLYK